MLVLYGKTLGDHTLANQIFHHRSCSFIGLWIFFYVVNILLNHKQFALEIKEYAEMQFIVTAIILAFILILAVLINIDYTSPTIENCLATKKNYPNSMRLELRESTCLGPPGS